MIHTTTTTGKFRRLVRKLRPMLGDVPCAVETIVVGILERLWHAGISSALRGDIGRFDDEEIAEMVGWHGDATALVELLVEEHWLDRHPDYRLLIHDWHEHAPRHVKANAKKQGGILTINGAHKATPNEVDIAQKEPPNDAKEVTPNLTKPNLTSPPNPPPAANGGDGVRSQAWKGVEEDLRKSGVVMAFKACDTARANGCHVEAVIDVIAFWKLHKPAWDAGALYTRIVGMRPGEDCSDFWPEPSSKFEAAQQREQTSKRHDLVVAERIEGQRRRESDDAARDRREKEFGPKLDAMSLEKIAALIREKLPSEAEFLLKRLPSKGKTSGILRESLLGYFESVAKREVAKC